MNGAPESCDPPMQAGRGAVGEAGLMLAVADLVVSRGERVLLRGLDIALGPGDGLLLTGPNGSGKSTLLRTLAGFLRPAAGRVICRSGRARDDREPGELLHFVGHHDGIKPALTVGANGAFWVDFLGVPGVGPSLEGVREVLVQFGLGGLDAVPAGYLSAGQQRRLGLARLALVPRPIWLLDEPTVSLDAAGQAMLAGLVDSHLDAGGIVIAATHVPLGMRLGQVLELGGADGASGQGAVRIGEGPA